MANNENLVRLSPSEARENGRKGGKASGEARRRKADFRKTLNMLLTAKIDSPEWTPLLESLGLESTLESALNMAMIKEGLAGNVKAYEAVARYAGQSEKTEADEDEQRAKTKQMEAQANKLGRDTPIDDVEDGVEVVNDAPEETCQDIGHCDTEVSKNI